MQSYGYLNKILNLKGGCTVKIKSNCCCFGLGDEVHVLEVNCPIKRKEGKRSYKSRGE